MTALPVPAPTASRTTPRPLTARLGTVMRLNFTNLFTTVYLPLLILAVIFAANWAIWYAVREAGGDVDTLTSGGVTFMPVYMLVVAVQTLNHSFAFALGMGATRRDFYVGSSVSFIVLSLFYSVLLTALAAVERATGGWGLRARFFAPDFTGRDLTFLETFGIYLVLLLLFFFIGAAVAAVYVRWGTIGMTVFWVGISALAVLVVLVLTYTGSWGSLWNTVVAGGLAGVLLWGLLVTVIAALSGYLVLRRTTLTR